MANGKIDSIEPHDRIVFVFGIDPAVEPSDPGIRKWLDVEYDAADVA